MHRLLWFLVLIPLVPLLGFLYQAVGACFDRRRVRPSSQWIRVGSRRFFVSRSAPPTTSGSAPAIVFECGLAASSQNWSHFQSCLGDQVNTLSYDRAGMGFSTASSSPRNLANLANELYALLLHARIGPPWILIGHSFGSLILRRFAADHPRDVIGVVLLDPMRVEEWSRWNEARRRLFDRSIDLMQRLVVLAQFGITRFVARHVMKHAGRISPRFASLIGEDARRLLERTTSELRKMPREVWPDVVAHWSIPAFYRGVAAQLRSLPSVLAEMEQVPPIEKAPVLVLIPASSGRLSKDSLALIAPQAEQWSVERSGHWVHLDRPDIVLQAIHSILTRTQPHHRARVFTMQARG